MTESRLLEKLRSRIRSAWDDDPLFIDPIVEPGLTANQLIALRRAADETEKSGIPYFIAIVPKMRDTVRSRDVWDRFTADLAFRVHEAGRAEQSIVLFTMAESSAKTFAYVVDDNGPAMPPDSAMFARSASDDFLPLELSVPHHLRTLVATAQGEELPPPPDFDTRDVGERDEDYIEATGLDNGNPDALVFGAAAVTALGLSVWLMRRRAKYSWRTSLTTSPDPVKDERLPQRVDGALEPLPEPSESDDELWRIYDRGRRVQDALTAIMDEHPDWADDSDFSHRFGVQNLLTTLEWVRKRLRGTASKKSEAPRFCFLFPHHRHGIERFALRQRGTAVTVDLCAKCRSEINDGHDPECLMVPQRPGAMRSKPVPYFQRSDVYAVAGFGSFQPLEDAVLDAHGAATARGRQR